MDSHKISFKGLIDWNETSNQEEVIYWTALNSIRDNATLDIVRKLVEQSISISLLWKGDVNTLASQIQVDINSLKKLRVKFGKIHLQEVLNDIEMMRGEGIRLIPLFDPRFPKKLLERSISSHPAPLVLLEMGEEVNTTKSVAIVGTRNPSLKGRISALELAEHFAGKGYVVISGLARGIDEFAHVGAMKNPDGCTIGVLPWLGAIYPPEHESLSEDIVKRGMIVSDVYSRSLPFRNKSRFIERNAIISGLSDFVIAIETDEEGGTIREAEIALKQGVKVYAFHINGNSRSERGYKKLTNMGAIGFENSTELEQLTSNSNLSTSYP